jgi:regulator of nucleoside diphosphate kinase
MLARNDAAAAAPPAIYVTRADYERLSRLLGLTAARSRGAQLLADELDRAIIVEADDLPGAFVRLGSRVSYEDQLTRKRRQVELVLPAAANIDEDRVSVFTPVGAALLGLTAGQSFVMPTEEGPRTLRILAVEDPVDVA